MKYVTRIFVLLLFLLLIPSCRKNQPQSQKVSSALAPPATLPSTEKLNNTELAEKRGPSNLIYTPNPNKLVFDIDDTKSIFACGGNEVLEEMKSKALTLNTFDSNVTIEKLKIPDSDPFSILNFFSRPPRSPEAQGEALPTSLFDFLHEDYFTQKVQDQSFWHFPKQTGNQNLNKAIEFSAVIKQKKFELEQSKILKIELFARMYDPKSEIEILTLGQGIAYNTPKKQLILKRIITEFDLDSAWWFRVKIERIGECLGKNQLADTHNSRDSIRSAILYFFYSDVLKDIFK